MRHLFTGALLLLGAIACPSLPTTTVPVPESVVLLDVRNDNWNDVVVYAYPCGLPQCAVRVGDVTAGGHRQFKLNRTHLTPMGELLTGVHVRAVGDQMFDSVRWSEDAKIELRVNAKLALSYVTVGEL